MSKKRQNFHYHYAEQYETRAERRARVRGRRRFVVSPAALLISVAMLVIFGLVSFTFSVYVTDSFDDPEMPASGGLVVTVKNETVRDQLQSVNVRDKSELTSTAAKVELAATGTTYPGGLKLYIKPGSNWKEGNAKFRVYVWDDSSHNATSALATQCTFDTDYYETTVPASSYTWLHYKWQRLNSAGDTVWDWASDSHNCSGQYNAYWNSGWEADGGFYNIIAPGTTLYGDFTQGTAWETTVNPTYFYVNNTNETSGAKNQATKIAAYLYRYTLPSNVYFDNSNAYYWRGDSNGLWNYAKPIPRDKINFEGYNATAVNGGISNENGIASTLTLDSLTKPEIDDANSTFKGGVAHTITVSNHSDVKLHYTFNSSERTTDLISTDRVYTYKIDGTTLGSNTTGSYTIPASYFTGAAGTTSYGTHTITVEVDSALTGLHNVSDNSSILVKNPYSCEIFANAQHALSYTEDVNEVIGPIAITTKYHTAGDNIVAAGVEDYVLVSTDGVHFDTEVTFSNVSASGAAAVSAGNLYLLSLQPTEAGSPAEVTVSCIEEGTAGQANYEECDDSTPAVISVAVDTPSISPSAAGWLWQDTTKSFAVTSTPATGTVSATVKTANPTLYSGTVGAISYASENPSLFTVASNGTVSPVSTSVYGTADLEISVYYNDVYTYETTRSVEVKARPDYYLKGLNHGWESDDTTKMSYDLDGSGVYYKTVWLDPNTSYDGGDTWGFKINSGSTWYSHSATDNYQFTSSNNSETLDTTGSNPNMKIRTGTYGGLYLFEFDTDTNELTITYPTSAKYYLLGLGSDDNAWLDYLKTHSDFARDREFSFTGNAGTRAITFAAGATYAGGGLRGFKVYCTDGNWYGKSSLTISHSNYTTAQTLTHNTSNSYNIGFNAWYSGSYTFNFNKSTKQLTVTPVPQRNVSKASAGVTNDSSIVSLVDGYNDRFTFTANDTIAYHFNGWTISGGTEGVDYTITSGSRSSNAMTLTVTKNTAITATANWVYRTYEVYYHTQGGSLSGAGITTVTANSLYKGTYTYNPTGASLDPLPTPSDPADKDWTFYGWYLGSTGSVDYSTAWTTIPATTYGRVDLWVYWTVTLTFKDNIDNSVIQTSTTRLNTALGSNPDLTGVSHEGFEFIAGSYTDSWTSSTVMGDSKTIYVIFTPVNEIFTVAIDLTDTDITIDNSGEYPVYVIPYGAKLSITATPTVDYTGTEHAEDIIYYWEESTYSASDFTLLHPLSLISTERQYNDYIYTNPDITSLMIESSGTYQIKVKAYYSGSYGAGNVWSSNSQVYTIRYRVDNPLSASASKSPAQLIYTESNFPDLIADLSLSTTGYDAALNTSDYAVKTILQRFMKGMGFTTIGSAADVAIDSTGPTFSTTFADAVRLGVNYFRIAMQRPKIVGFDAGTSGTEGDVYKINDEIQYSVEQYTGSVSTTVGTASSGAARPLYLTIDNAVLGTPGNYRVMLFYNNDSAQLSFQTAAVFTLDGTRTYRFMIPGDVEEVSIGVFDKAEEYILPAYTGGDPDFDDTDCFGYSALVDVVDAQGAPIQKLSITACTDHEFTVTSGSL